MFSSFHRLLFVRVCLLAGCLISLAPGLRAAEPRQWALLIGVQEHDNKQLNLHFTENDVQRLRQALTERAGMSKDYILQMTDGTADHRPTLANLKRELPDFLAKPEKEDRVIVFFSGHGVLFEGKTYLVPRDFDASNPAGTGLKLAEVRKALDECKAHVKFLILDCCHAGNDKAPDNTLSPAKIAQEITNKTKKTKETIRNCMVLASCDEDETSKEWTERKQGLFTYWLCRGLEGAAADDQGRVTIDKLNSYVRERVSETAKELHHEQTPQRFGKLSGNPELLRLQPESPESLCRRLAEDIDIGMRRRKLKKVGVLEFLVPLGKVVGLGRSILPAYCAEQVRQALTKLGTGSYQVLSAAGMQCASKGIAVAVIGNPKDMHRLGERGNGLDAVVTGNLRRRGLYLVVQCELVTIAKGDRLANPGGVLPLSPESVTSLDSRSGDFRDAPSGKPHDEAAVRYADEQTNTGHPLLDEKFPFRVEVRTNPGKETKNLMELPVKNFAGEKRIELLIAASKGETFEIYVHNKSKQRVALLLMMDGLNSLDQKRTRIGKGRKWILEAGKGYSITGWTFPERKDEKGKSLVIPFKFVDAAKSVAGRQNFSESIGVITAAFYAEGGRKLGIGGDEQNTVTREVKVESFRVGRLLGVVNIRYVDKNELGK